jgi:hypothetical protein
MPYMKMLMEGCTGAFLSPALAFWFLPPQMRIFYMIKGCMKRRN